MFHYKIYLVFSIFFYWKITSKNNLISVVGYSEIFLINNCQCQNEVKNHTVPP
jgi:hypothetical protein